eukprot:Nitzschia sp. Nitz4//scaffold88_size82704//77609//78631//NITZ4_005307-RA/size82704-processed-gene-0.75-mRNA-1//-1//CDS//3329559539//373//frame0
MPFCRPFLCCHAKEYATIASCARATSRRYRSHLSNLHPLQSSFQTMDESNSRHFSTTAANNINSNNNHSWKDNPVFTRTALAHYLWSHILIPHVDSAIDATCGNGQDSLALAQLLFDKRYSNTTGSISGEQQQLIIPSDSQSQLLCLDIQPEACLATTQALSSAFGTKPDGLDPRIQVSCTSHSPLPQFNTISNMPNHQQVTSLGLVVYNLGWLPNNKENKRIITQMDTTMYSIVDALVRVRVGGMVCVTTYPKTNPHEDLAVRGFLELIGQLSSKKSATTVVWPSFIEGQESEVGSMVEDSLERFYDLQGDSLTSWRVSEHRNLGMDGSPILVTATRIK